MKTMTHIKNLAHLIATVRAHKQHNDAVQQRQSTSALRVAVRVSR